MMNIETKEKLLRSFAKSVIDSPANKDRIKALLDHFDLSEEQLIQAYVDYDLDVLGYDNQIYEPIVMRLVLYLHSLLPGSWHQERQDTFLEYLSKIEFDSAIDIGFGIPTKYLIHHLQDKTTKKFTLTDIYDSAFEFAETLLSGIDGKWHEKVNFLKADMDDEQYPGDYDVYLFQDSIEHTKNPSRYLKLIVDRSPIQSKFIFSLPICPLVPSHYIEYKDKEAAIEWLENAGLRIIGSKDIFVNPEVDLFAHGLSDKISNFVALCEKKTASV